MEEKEYNKIAQSIVCQTSAATAKATADTGYLDLVIRCLDNIYEEIRYHAKYGFRYIKWSTLSIKEELGLSVPQRVQDLAKEYLESDGYKVTMTSVTSERTEYMIEW